MFTDDQIESVMKHMEVSSQDYFTHRLHEVVAHAVALGVLEEDVSLWTTGDKFLVTLRAGDLHLASDPQPIEMLSWAGFLGPKAIRGALMMVEKEARFLRLSMNCL